MGSSKPRFNIHDLLLESKKVATFRQIGAIPAVLSKNMLWAKENILYGQCSITLSFRPGREAGTVSSSMTLS